LVPLVPILGIVASLILMLFLPLNTWIRLVVWLVIGMAIYLSYGRKHSRVRRYVEVHANVSAAKRA
jgi:APA family basic amino acid/polyamine antiporter